MFNVYQIKKNPNFTDAELQARLDIKFFGASEYKAEHFSMYTKTAVCDAEHCEEVFELMNLWNDREKVYFWNGERPYSLSVGDIVQHTESEEYYMVDEIGFSTVKVQ
jgi:hypothetical protein